MSGLGIRSGSYGSLDKQVQQNNININNNNNYNSNGNSNSNNNYNNYSGVLLPIQTARKPSKMLKEKEKEKLFHWICKFAGRKKVGMLLLCVISAAVFVWVLYVGKGLPLLLSLSLSLSLFFYFYVVDLIDQLIKRIQLYNVSLSVRSKDLV